MSAVRAALTAAAGARTAWAVLTRAVPGGTRPWQRTNHRGETVTLLEGPAYAAGALAGVLAAPGLPRRVRVAATVAVASSAVLGGLDDLFGTGTDKGLRGHLGALAHGRLTTGAVKVGGIGAAGLVAAATVLGRRRPGVAGALDVVVAGGVVAGTANLVNLLDLRPGRALKATLAPAVLALTGGPGGTLLAAGAGAAAALVREDLGERAMLGDTGANAAGALLGCAAVAGTADAGRAGALARAGLLAGLTGLTLASERVSFTAVIERTPVLRALDRLGRRA